MYQEFNHEVVLVTGGSSGIGKATALAFAKWGAQVIITGRDEAKGKAVLAEAEQHQWNLDFWAVDMAKPEQVEAMIQKIAERYGRLDIAFNNAGIDGEMARTADCSIENWQQVMNINLNGVFYCMKYELQEMLKNQKGMIVNNVSVSGHKGYPGGIAYVASKHGLVGLTKAAAMEYAAKNIRVNGISPGLIRTPMTDKDREARPHYDEWVNRVEPLGRIGEAEEVAESVLWLCSSRSSFVTGHILAVDGGILAC